MHAKEDFELSRSDWGDYIQRERERQGISRRDLAMLSNVSYFTLRDWEQRGVPRVFVSLVRALAALNHEFKRCNGRDSNIWDCIRSVDYPPLGHGPKENERTDDSTDKTNGKPA